MDRNSLPTCVDDPHYTRLSETDKKLFWHTYRTYAYAVSEDPTDDFDLELHACYTEKGLLTTLTPQLVSTEDGKEALRVALLDLQAKLLGIRDCMGSWIPDEEKWKECMAYTEEQLRKF